MGLYVVSFASCATTFVFLPPIALRLSRVTPEAIECRRRYEANEITMEEYEKGMRSQKSRLANTSWLFNMAGYFIASCLALSILRPLRTNPKADNYALVVMNAYWVPLGLWWFISQKSRPGPPLPKGKHYLTLGWMRLWEALKHYRRLPYTFIYLFGYFLIADAVNTAFMLVVLCQNKHFEFSFLQQTYFGLAQSASAVVSIAAFRHQEIGFRTPDHSGCSRVAECPETSTPLRSGPELGRSATHAFRYSGSRALGRSGNSG